MRNPSKGEAMVLQTEYEFTLPKGYVDRDGNVSKRGTMRLATAADEILPLKDPRVQQNPAYHTVIALSRVVSKLEGISEVNTHVIENMWSSDVSYLQDLYQQINGDGARKISTKCPQCSGSVEVTINPGE
ncbi:MAG: hypothetical protein NPIRA04_04770 [Nitrospirales bacterium]|nr:MAG: hypothetical protein NPIRA04_04770 [Nitrospirales bacterium]